VKSDKEVRNEECNPLLGGAPSGARARVGSSKDRKLSRRDLFAPIFLD
jgi:hypothetical protein